MDTKSSVQIVVDQGQNYGAIPPSERTVIKIEKNLKRMVAKKWVILLISGAFIAILGAVLFPAGDKVIRDQIEKKMIISPDSVTYDIWQNNPVPIYMQFYIFNIENPEDVLKGEIPYLTQYGPYTYRQRRVKFDIVWESNGTVTYRQNKTYHFIPELSKGKDTDVFTTINPLCATVAQAIKWLPEYVRVIVSSVLTIAKADGLFMKRPVKEILWGYDDPTLEMLNGIIPLWFHSTTIGYFTHRNDTNDGLYSVYTGSSDINKLGQIEKFNRESHVDIWSSPWANMINGSDGTVGHPFQFDRLVSSAFLSQLCRSISGYYREIVHSPQGIPLRRFVGSAYTFANTSINPDNAGFCIPTNNCLPSGFLNQTFCQRNVDYFQVPAVVSFPHFLYADPNVQAKVHGLSPNREEHETAIDIEPWTGSTLQASSKLQINFFVQKVKGFSPTSNVSEVFFPILWLNQRAQTDKKHEELLLNQLFVPMTILTVAKITLLVIGGLMCVVAIFVIFKRREEEAVPLKSMLTGDNSSDRGEQESSHAYTSLAQDILESPNHQTVPSIEGQINNEGSAMPNPKPSSSTGYY